VTEKTDAETIHYNPMLFGQFIEHFDNQVYGGIFDPGNPLSDEEGFRKDVIQALRDIHTSIVRWPGGCFVSSYHWKYGVGKNREPMYDKAWQVEDPNTFGTDEYVSWCRKVGCEPYICTNAGTGTPEEMSDWVEYCNLTMGKWGRMRMENGHPEPYNVKYWSVGNENYGPWEIGAHTPEEWAPLVSESAKMMLAVTKDAQLLAAATTDPNWTHPLLKAAGRYLNYISIHGYWDALWLNNNPSPYEKCMMWTTLPEKQIQDAIKLLEDTGFGGGKIKIAFDEWNLRGWHHPWHGNLREGFDIEARRKNDLNETYTMADALFSACFLNACLRHSDIVDIACFAPIVNTRGAVFVHKDGLVKRSTYYVFQMYTNLLEPYYVPAECQYEEYRHEDGSTPMMDVAITRNEEGTHYACAVVNKDPEKAHSIVLNVAGKVRSGKVKATLLSGNSADDYNDIGRENVLPRETELRMKDGKVEIPAHTLAVLDINVK